MDCKPLVTIGITSYNYELFIEAALNSVLDQTYKNIEIIIIDDYSQDSCPALINHWIEQNCIKCIYIQHQINLGITKTLNEIVNLANGKYITFLATDDIMLPERVEKQVAELEDAGNEFGMCYANALTIDEEGNDMGYYSKNSVFDDGFILEKFLTKEIYFATPVMMLRTSVFSKVGMFDTRVLIEDYNFFVRLMAVYKVKYCTYPCVIYRQKIKIKSTIHELVASNNSELFYRDRIISNYEALKFITSKTVKQIFKNKINKALRNLAYNNSQYYYKMLFFLLTNFYFHIPVRTVFSKLKHHIK